MTASLRKEAWELREEQTLQRGHLRAVLPCMSQSLLARALLGRPRFFHREVTFLMHRYISQVARRVFPQRIWQGCLGAEGSDPQRDQTDIRLDEVPVPDSAENMVHGGSNG